MPIQFFNPTFRPNVAPANLTEVAKSYDTLEAGHQQAMQLKSSIDAQLAQLDLNEAEDAWRQEQLAKIRNTLTENMNYGNAYSSIDNMVSKFGDITSNPGMIGRLRAQKDYKDYITKLDARKDLSEDYKNYYKEVNKYSYKDIKDKNGNVIGGSKWTPIDQEVTEIPMNQILNQALQWAAKEQGGGTSTRWLDANGKVTDDITKSVTGEIYSQSTGQWQRLSKEKLAAAVTAVIENTPGAKASLDQDYKIAKWKYDKNGANPDITDKNGNILTPQEYLAKRIDPFYKAATYYNQTSKTTYGEAWKAQLALKNAGSVATSPSFTGSGGNVDFLTTRGTPTRIDNFVPTNAQASITSSKQGLADLIIKHNPNVNFNLDKSDAESMRQLVLNNIKNPADKWQALNYIDTIIENQEYLNDIKNSTADKGLRDAFDTYNAVMSMSDLPNIESNESSKKYAKVRNKLFGDGAAIRQYFDDDDIYNAFVTNIGGESKAKNLGINLGIASDGRKFAQLNKENNKSVYAFSKAAENAEQTRSLIGKIWQTAKQTFNFGDTLVQIDSEGNEISANISKASNALAGIGTAMQSTFSPTAAVSSIYAINENLNNTNPYREIINTVDDLSNKNNQILNGGTITIGGNIITETSPNAATTKARWNRGEFSTSDFKAQYDLDNDAAENAFSSLNLTQTTAYGISDNGILEKLSSDDAMILTKRLWSAKKGDITANMKPDPRTGRWGAEITIKGSIDSSKGDLKYEPVTFFVPDAYDSATIQSWNRDTSFRSLNDITLAEAAHKESKIYNSTSFANMPKISIVPTNGGFSLIDKTKGTNYGMLDIQAAAKLREAYLNWDDACKYVVAGEQIDVNALKAMALETGQVISNITSNGNPEVADYYANVLIQNLTGE